MTIIDSGLLFLGHPVYSMPTFNIPLSIVYNFYVT